MKTSITFYGVVILVWCASVAHAQSTPPRYRALSFRWYAAAQLANHRFEIVVPGHVPGLTGVEPYQLTVGRWLTPRWAAEVAFSSYHFLYEGTNYGTTEKGEPTSRYLYAADWVRAAPLLLRRRLTREANHRLQFDGILGAIFVRYRDKIEVVETTNEQVVWQSSTSSQATNAYLTLGPAASYRFGRHLEGCFDLLLIKNLHNINRTFSTQQLNSTLGFQRGWSLGLRYCFDAKKKTIASAAP